jgi:hypothetical protein
VSAPVEWQFAASDGVDIPAASTASRPAQHLGDRMPAAMIGDKPNGWISRINALSPTRQGRQSMDCRRLRVLGEGPPTSGSNATRHSRMAAY